MPNKKELEDAWDALKKQMSSGAQAATPTGSEALSEGGGSFAGRFGDWAKDKLDIQKTRPSSSPISVSFCKRKAGLAARPALPARATDMAVAVAVAAATAAARPAAPAAPAGRPS